MEPLFSKGQSVSQEGRRCLENKAETTELEAESYEEATELHDTVERNASKKETVSLIGLLASGARFNVASLLTRS